jgi:hypothetical protein
MLVLSSVRNILSGKLKGPPIFAYHKLTETRDKVSYTLLGNTEFHAQKEFSKLRFYWFSWASPYSWRKSISIQATTTSFHSTQFTILYIFYYFIYRLIASLYKPYTINHYCLLRRAWKGLKIYLLLTKLKVLCSDKHTKVQVSIKIICRLCVTQTFYFLPPPPPQKKIKLYCPYILLTGKSDCAEYTTYPTTKKQNCNKHY